MKRLITLQTLFTATGHDAGLSPNSKIFGINRSCKYILSMKASEPSVSANEAVSSSTLTEIAIIRQSHICFMSRVWLSTSLLIRTSITTISGRCCATSRAASSKLLASPTTSTSSLVDKYRVTVRRITSESSATKTLMGKVTSMLRRQNLS
jgi:hypothetical protein